MTQAMPLRQLSGAYGFTEASPPVVRALTGYCFAVVEPGSQQDFSGSSPAMLFCALWVGAAADVRPKCWPGSGLIRIRAVITGFRRIHRLAGQVAERRCPPVQRVFCLEFFTQ